MFRCSCLLPQPLPTQFYLNPQIREIFIKDFCERPLTTPLPRPVLHTDTHLLWLGVDGLQQPLDCVQSLLRLLLFSLFWLCTQLLEGGIVFFAKLSFTWEHFLQGQDSSLSQKDFLSTFYPSQALFEGKITNKF